MSLFGKILIVLNGIIVALFFFLAMLLWGQRETWADNYLQHQLMIVGLPLDAKETDEQGQPLVDNIRKPLLKQMFKTGKEFATQEEALKDVQVRIQASIDGKQTPKDKALQQLKVLEALADTQSDREKLAANMAEVAKAADPKTEELQLQINAAFARIPPAPPPSADETKKQAFLLWKKDAIADLLCRLSDVLRLDEATEQPPALLDSKAYEQFLTVVGVSRGSAALDRFTTAKRQFAADLKASIDRDRVAFAADYQKRMEQINVVAAQLRELEDFLTRQKTLLADRGTQVAGREKLRDDLKKDLQQKRDDVAKMLADQKALEEMLFKTRQELRDAFFENQTLEQTLKTLEKSR